MILGATNRMQDIDEAILRRMPKKFAVSLPNKDQRRRILKLILKDTKTDPEHFDLDYLTRVTAGMSGSDIKEACRDAAMVPVREYIREQRTKGTDIASVSHEAVRGIRTEDFFGRKGGGQILANNHAHYQSQLRKMRGESDKVAEVEEIDDDDEAYEDVEESVGAESQD
jgi:SpoVK/Ycf46/Vps4 family AAA+-type ATPase